MTELKNKKFDLNTLIDVADDEQWINQLESTQGGDYAPPPEGRALAHITGYIDLGKHKNSRGQLKDQAILTMMLFDTEPSDDPKYTKTIKDDDGNEIVTGTPLTVNLPARSANEKSHMFKLFNRFAKALEIEPKNGILSPTQFLGKEVAVRIFHNEVGGENGKKAKVYANIRDADGDMDITAPYFTNRNGEIDKNEPMVSPKDAHIDYKLFMWESPRIEHWQSIYIDGEREVDGEDGKKKKVSKNWMQDKIREAENFQDSPTAAMLAERGSSAKVVSKATDNKVSKKKDTEVEEEATESQPRKDVDVEALKSKIESTKNAIDSLKDAGMDTSSLDKELAEMQKTLESVDV